MVTKVWILTPGSGHQAVKRVASSSRVPLWDPLGPGSRIRSGQEALTALVRDTRMRVPDGCARRSRASEDPRPKGTNRGLRKAQRS